MKKKIPYTTKKKIYGFLFITPWLLGFLLFFIVPFIQSCLYAFQDLETTEKGMVGTWVGTYNFSYALFRDTDFIVQCANSLKDLITVPLILVYSLCFALLLKKEYPGRTTMRAIAFLPVIIGSGVLMDIIFRQTQPCCYLPLGQGICFFFVVACVINCYWPVIVSFLPLFCKQGYPFHLVAIATFW